MNTVKSLIYKCKEGYREDKYSDKGIVNFFSAWGFSVVFISLTKDIKIDYEKVGRINKIWKFYIISRLEKDVQRQLFFKKKLVRYISEISVDVEKSLNLLEKDKESIEDIAEIDIVKKIRGCIAFELNE